MAQFGVAALPGVSSHWRSQPIKDDPVLQSNARGTISFASSGPNTRTAQLFLNFVDNKYLDREGFTPIGRVIEGMERVVDHLFHHYGEGGRGDGTDGKGPNQGRINTEGKAYLDKVFPKLSYIKYATVLESYLPPQTKP
jgi:peptidyl-prolyl cis-trans isomerase A (cyclophilin A)